MDSPNFIACLGASFAAGLGSAVFILRLRDRERLRKTCSRTMKWVTRQRSALGLDIGRYLTKHNIGYSEKSKVVIIGAGNFGTAMAYVALSSLNKNDVVMYMRDPDQCECINKKGYNPKYLSDYKLNRYDSSESRNDNNSVRAICKLSDLRYELRTPGAIIIHALPCQKTPQWFRDNRDLIPPETLICTTTKGLYLPTRQLMGHAILDALDRVDQPLAFLSGPSFAVEIMKSNPTVLIVASDQLLHAVKVQKLLNNSSSIRIHTSNDPVGVQLGGALKNPLAVGAGMISGMGFGINTLSSLVTLASFELRKVCIAMGGNPKTIDGLAGVGDLMLTCFSSQSRNNRCGQRLIKGEMIEDILKDYTVEGIPTADVAIEYADLCGLDLPIFRTVHALIHKQITPNEAVSHLMAQPFRHNLKQLKSRSKTF